MNGSNCRNKSMRTPAGGLPCELVALVAPSQAKVTECGDVSLTIASG